MSTATLSLVKVAWIRAEGYPEGQRAPGRLNCRCKGAPLTQLKPEQGDVRCACGALYSWDGYVIEPAPKPIHGAPKPQNVPADMQATPPVECVFKVGDVVTYTNDQGLSFSPRIVRGFCPVTSWGAFIYITTDCWWSPVKPANLKHLTT